MTDKTEVEIKYLYENEYDDGSGTDTYEIKYDPNINISCYAKSKLQHPSTIVIKDTKIKIMYKCQLKKAVIFEYKSKNGFSRGQLIEHIINTYKQIYKGNDIGDLFIEGITYSPKKKLVMLQTGS